MHPLDPEHIDAEQAEELDRLRRPEALARAARWYAREGIPVFPLRIGEKRPATRHGLNDATTDLDLVRAWWEHEPQANIGLATGHRMDVIDVDPPEGWTSLERMRAAELVPPTLAYVVTPRTGAHLWVPPTGDGNAAGLLPGIDYRGIGGYVVGPPSRCQRGMWLFAERPVWP